MQIKIAHTCCLQCLDSKRLPLCLSHHALDLVIKSKGLIAAWPLKMFCFNRCLGKNTKFRDSICTGPCSCLTRSLGLSAHPLSLRLPLLHICWQGISESFAQPLLLGCYWSRDYVLWGQAALCLSPTPTDPQSEQRVRPQVCWIQPVLQQQPGFCLCTNPEWLNCTWTCVRIPN